MPWGRSAGRVTTQVCAAAQSPKTFSRGGRGRGTSSPGLSTLWASREPPRGACALGYSVPGFWHRGGDSPCQSTTRQKKNISRDTCTKVPLLRLGAPFLYARELWAGYGQHMIAFQLFGCLWRQAPLFLFLPPKKPHSGSRLPHSHVKFGGGGGGGGGASGASLLPWLLAI